MSANITAGDIMINRLDPTRVILISQVWFSGKRFRVRVRSVENGTAHVYFFKTESNALLKKYYEAIGWEFL